MKDYMHFYQNNAFMINNGFCNRHFTNQVLLDITEDIRSTMDDNKFAVGVFLDLQKAFDTVYLNILLKSPDHYGIRGVDNNWFKSYLSNRKQFLIINGVDSDLQSMKFGVPRGSFLGTLLFLIYINDLHSTIKFCTTRHCADNTNLLTKNSL